MVLYVNSTGFIYGWNDQLTQSEMTKYKDTIWYEGGFDFENVGVPEGKAYKLYLTSEDEIEVRYEDEPVTPELTQLDHIEAATEYLMAMQE